jgi:hypothetical protein
MVRRLAPIWLILGLSFLPGIAAQAQRVSLGFTMPQSVDPPVKKFLNTNSVETNSAELDEAIGVELHGRALAVTTGVFGCQLQYKDVTAVQIQFVYSGNISVKSGVAQGFQNYKPWAVQSSFERSTNTWTILLTAQPGSALLSDWDVIGGALPQGFFAKLTANQGNRPAPITNVRITPLHLVTNANQRSSHDVIDVTAPEIQAAVSSPTIWSPNDKPVDVTLTATLRDGGVEDGNNYISGLDLCSLSVTLIQVEGGVTTPLGEVPFTLTDNGDGSVGLTAALSLSASRNGYNAEGRVYHITITSTDFIGNTSQSTVTVTVTHDQSNP